VFITYCFVILQFLRKDTGHRQGQPGSLPVLRPSPSHSCWQDLLRMGFWSILCDRGLSMEHFTSRQLLLSDQASWRAKESASKSAGAGKMEVRVYCDYLISQVISITTSVFCSLDQIIRPSPHSKERNLYREPIKGGEVFGNYARSCFPKGFLCWGFISIWRTPKFWGYKGKPALYREVESPSVSVSHAWEVHSSNCLFSH
jgi:hypothetical protein